MTRYCPHSLAIVLLPYLFLDGLSFDLLVAPWLDPGSFRHPSAVMLQGALSMPVALVGTIR